MANYIGIDIGKNFLQIYSPVDNSSFAVDNTQSGFKKIIANIFKYNQRADYICVFEPTGGYEKHLKSYLQKRDIAFVVVHPNKVRAFAKATGLMAKTDKIDSKLLHDFAVKFNLNPQEYSSFESEDKLRALTRRREQLIRLRNKEISRLETVTIAEIIGSIKLTIEYLNEQLASIENAIEECRKNSKLIKDKIDRLTSIPGVGQVLACAVVCDLPELGKAEFRQITSLVGIAPFARSSGKYNGRRSIFAGRNNIRRVLYMAAVASLRANSRLKAFYERLIANHKPPKVALVAVMRKLLSFMHAISKNNSSWQKTISC